ncbi:unnamed protein product [Mytilus edulis]|uniref:Uncharacterized protein n=1 Tax=Mytilus edulis TaxID=6550 RepID=A0A8S3UWW2_MYTED|nr:unnamed protein product [Mytilus edulis]
MNTSRSNNMEGTWNYQPCRNGHPFPMRKADTCLDFLCKYCEETKLHINKLKESNRNFIKEIAVLKCENSKLDTVVKDNVILRNNLDKVNLERLEHGRIIQKIEHELAEHASRTENFEREIVRLKEENLSLTNTRYRLTMDLKSKEMQDCHVIKNLKDEIQKLKIQKNDDLREYHELLSELSIVESQLENWRTNYSHNSRQHQRRGYPRR